MIAINKAILHTMDAALELYFCADEELLLDLNVNAYLIRHLEKITKQSSAQKGTFKGTSKLYGKIKQYTSDDFLTLSREIANTWFGAYAEAMRFLDMNLLFVEYVENDTLYYAALRFNNKQGYIRQISREDGIVRNEILTYASLIPSMSQNVDEYFIINMSDFSIRLKEDKYYLNREEELLISDQILYCHIEKSTKDALKTLDEIVTKVSHELDEDVLENTLKYKQYVNLCTQTDQKLNVDEICEQVFKDNDDFAQRFEELSMESKLPETIELQKKAPASLRRHKIKTDSGIEIIIPVDYAEVKDNVLITNNEDGTISISLHHVGKIVE